jgi:hypothetical protein
MKRRNDMAEFLAAAVFAIAVASPVPCLAHRFGPQQHHSAPPAHAQHAPAPRPQQNHSQNHPQAPGRAPQNPQQPQGHAGDWLRRYKDLPPEEQERALQNDPAFRHLPAEQQQQLRQRLQHFSSLPPQRQLQMLNRMETWEHLTPEQKQQAREVYNQMRQLPPARQRMATTAVRDLRTMTPEQRDQVIDSPRFKSMFSDQEREMIRGASRLPLAPAEGGEGPPPQE